MEKTYHLVKILETMKTQRGGWMCVSTTRITKKTYPICGSLSNRRQHGVLLRWDVSGSLVSQAMFLDLGGPNFV